ncbi:multiple sugar transport system substrate-binding protein [Asanoa hainanensis]|uniref:Multiple sugar transport system substrate-binding protein n=1 Tax=Asanoa hainanensis TaxID=560556 RepID=A0A239PFC6_9ACTN|nr:sugar ABC transporter substrate-binding protein [Asanoa hainanensis]SNT65807.1 multiple sugar transport system substrate-binding protein [Asanoa hainanensis]
MKWRKSAAVAAAALTAAGVLAGCGSSDSGSGSGSGSGGKVDLSYWLWDANQQPGYQKCADAFTAANPNISVTVKQYGWDDYWSSITTGLVSGTAPDVFTNHASYFPTFVDKHQILPIDDEQVDLSAYRAGLPELWVGTDGKRYGLPKDNGLVGLYANAGLLEKAGKTAADLANLTWNPTDGGTFEQLIAHLTVDKAGKRGDEAGFDKTKVEVYGLGLNGAGDGSGESIWAQYALSNGWTYYSGSTSKPVFNYNDPKFTDTMKWFRGLSDKGFMPSLKVASSGIGMQASYGAGKYAMTTDGVWSAKSYFELKDVKTTIAPLPTGPAGRQSTTNALGDAVTATTKHPAEAKKLLVFLGGKDCQSIVAKEGVVLPAITSAIEEAKATFKTNGIDIQPFLEPKTSIEPVVPNWADAMAIFKPAMEAFLNGQTQADSFVGVNDQINALYK